MPLRKPGQVLNPLALHNAGKLQGTHSVHSWSRNGRRALPARAEEEVLPPVLIGLLDLPGQRLLWEGRNGETLLGSLEIGVMNCTSAL